jgi:hypothetical protein
VFRVPEDGLYRFSIGGYGGGQPITPDTRFAWGLFVNEVWEALGGGQLSTSDTPMSTFTHLVHLTKGDEVNPGIFVPQAITIGSSIQGHAVWFQGQYVRSDSWT